MARKWVKRHYDYVLTIPTLAGNSQLTQIPLQINTRAPFVLKGRAVRMKADSTFGQGLLNKIAIRYTGPDQEYLAQAAVPWGPMAMCWGQGCSPVWTQTPILYPAGGVILVDVWNFSSTTILNLQLYFRGWELWEYGSVYAPAYPDRFTALPFTQLSNLASIAVVDNGPNLNQTMQLFSQNDFALRGGYYSWPTSSQKATTDPIIPFETFITLYDWQKVAYSNAPVQLDIMFGNHWDWLNAGSAVENELFVIGYGSFPNCNGYMPGLFTPEIYVPRNQFLWFDITRNDDATFGGHAAVAQQLLIGWTGMKVNG